MKYFRIHYNKANNWQLSWGRIAALNNWDELSFFQTGTNRHLDEQTSLIPKRG